MTYEGYTHPEYLVEADWLAAHLDDENVVVVDCDVDAGYQRGHVPEAVLIPDNFVKDPDSDRVLMMTPPQFKAMCENLGISDDSLVICYDNARGVTATRLWWILNTYGHRDAKVLNGGWRSWVVGGHTISMERPARVEGVSFTPRIDDSMLVTVDKLKEACSLQESVVWDVRSDGEWDGSATRGNKRAGHVPGAVHLEWFNLMDRETHRFKSASEIRQVLSEHGITPDKNLYTY